MSNYSNHRNQSFISHTSGHTLRNLSQSILPDPLDPTNLTQLDKKEMELESLSLLNQLSKDTLNQINVMSIELKTLNQGYQSIDRLLDHWNDIFRFANIAVNKRAENGEPPVLVKLDCTQGQS